MNRLLVTTSCAALVGAAVTGAYIGVVTGRLTLDLGIGRRTRPLGPLHLDIAAPRETVFAAAAAQYADRQPRAMGRRGSFAQGRVRHLLRAQDLMQTASAFIDAPISARSLLLHSLAHVLINELSLTAGYPTAGIRERVYDDEGQTGILVFTATADSAGSLGGLAAQSDPSRFQNILRSAATRALWCTTDPVCIESAASGVNGMNLAACHACLLVPETSCERFNLLLDRATLVGLPGQEQTGVLRSGLRVVTAWSANPAVENAKMIMVGGM